MTKASFTPGGLRAAKAREQSSAIAGARNGSLQCKMEVFLSTRGQTFRQVMPLAMRNLAIAQQRDKERYSLVRGGSWAKPKAAFEPGNYVLVKRVKPNTLEAPAYPHVLRIVELRPSGIMVLEGSDGARCTNQMKASPTALFPFSIPPYTRGDTGGGHLEDAWGAGIIRMARTSSCAMGVRRGTMYTA